MMLRYETDRLIVRRPNVADLGDYLAFRNHPQNLSMQPADPATPDRASALLARQAEMPVGVENIWVMLAVELKGEHRMIGEVGVFLFDKTASLGNLGWIIHADFQQRGYAHEAVQTLFHYVFDVEGLRRVTGNCPTCNDASFRLMEKLGMRREAHMRQSRQWKGDWFDEYAYALLRDEWQSPENLWS